MPRFSAVFFDFDGTLASERSGVRESRLAVSRAVAERGLRVRAEEFVRAAEIFISETLAANNGAWPSDFSAARWIDGTLQRLNLRQAVGDRFLVELATLYGEERVRRLERVHGADEALTAARALGPVGLITNYADPALQRRKIAQLGLEEAFDCVVISGEVGVWKPEAGIFHAALSQLYAEPSEAVYIGNSYWHDVVGAVAAGMHAYWVPEGDDGDAVEVGEAPHTRFASLAEVAQSLRYF